MSTQAREVPTGELLFLALEVAHAAGKLLVRGRPGSGRAALAVDTKSSPTDIVTEMDRAAEELITVQLAKARPADAILGEEGADRPGTSGVRWVVDPLDGTVNYLYDLGGWAVSIAAEVGGRSVAGVVYVPSAGETFAAELGGGATCNELPLRLGPGPALDRALVATGFGYHARRRAHQAAVLARVLPLVRDIRRFGACAVDLCSVASGRVDGYYERGVNPWDFAAGGLVATEAGARVEGLRGAAPSDRFLLAAPPEVFGPLHDVLAAAGADEGEGYAESER